MHLSASPSSTRSRRLTLGFLLFSHSHCLPSHPPPTPLSQLFFHDPGGKAAPFSRRMYSFTPRTNVNPAFDEISARRRGGKRGGGRRRPTGPKSSGQSVSNRRLRLRSGVALVFFSTPFVEILFCVLRTFEDV